MKRLLFIALLAFITTVSTAQVVFYESFDGIPGPQAGGAGTYSFPAGWFLRNVDNRTPDAQVAYVNEAWERREDFNFNVGDSCAFSTSYYGPAGASDDWMWTPLISSLPVNSVLSWNAVAYDPNYRDGYEVRIMTAAQGPPTGGTGTLGNQVSASTVIFSTTGENSGWTTRTFNLSAYVGQAVYIGFRNNSNDKFLLLIDDVKVEVVNDYDAQVTAANPYEYTLAPRSHASVPLGGTVKNMGQLSLTNVSLAANVYNSSGTMVFGSVAFSIPSLAPAATNNFSLGDFIPTASGTYTIKYYPSMSQTDQKTTNDTMTRTVVITDSVFARDDGIATNALGIAAGDGYIGTSFTITSSAELRSVTAYYTRGYVGRKYACVIWNTTMAGVPNNIIASTDTLLYQDDNAFWDTIPIYGGYVSLSPGKYVVTAIEFDSTVQVGTTSNIYTAGTNWVKWSGNPAWANIETFGSQYQRAFLLRMNVTINNNDPVITSNGGGTAAGVSIAENISAAATVTATDADAASTVYYVLNGGADASLFNINAATGALSFITPPDFESPGDADANNTYIVMIRATDGARHDDQTITVTVTDANDNNPVITSNGGAANAGISINENVAAVTTVTATDADAGTTLAYSINGGADAAKFSINSSTGVLTFLTAQDFESPTDADANNTYIVVVRAGDGTNNTDQTIIVTIDDLNDNNPVITSNGGGSAASVSVLNPQQNVTTVTATDTDGSLNTLSYSITGGVDAGDFSINASTGQLSFINPTDVNSPQDADLNNTYLVTVQVSDGTFTDNQSVTVTVTGTLPVTLMRFVGWTTINNNMLEWSTVNETEMDSYEVEKSSNGHEFAKAGTVAAMPQTANNYHYADAQYYPLSFYRLKMKGKDGRVTYSNIIKLDRGNKSISVRLYPNPVHNGSFALQLNNLPKERYTVSLYDAAGQLVMQQVIQHPGGTATALMKLSSAVTKGVYAVAVKGKDLAFNERIIVE